MQRKLFPFIAFAWIAPLCLATMMTSDTVWATCFCDTQMSTCSEWDPNSEYCAVQYKGCCEQYACCTPPKPHPHHLSLKKTYPSDDTSTSSLATPLGN